MKRHWGTDELVERWTLLPRETELLTQIPKLGNRPRPRRRARFIGLLRREKSQEHFLVCPRGSRNKSDVWGTASRRT